MGRTTKPRKPHRHKDISLNSLNWAMAGVHLLRAEVKAQLLEHVASAMDRLRDGSAGADDFETVMNALNIAKSLAQLNIGTNLHSQIKAAADAVHRLGCLHRDSINVAAAAANLALIAGGIAVYKVQLDVCTQAEMSRAVRHVENVIRGGGARCVVQPQAA